MTYCQLLQISLAPLLPASARPELTVLVCPCTMRSTERPRPCQLLLLNREWDLSRNQRQKHLWSQPLGKGRSVVSSLGRAVLLGPPTAPSLVGAHPPCSTSALAVLSRCVAGKGAGKAASANLCRSTLPGIKNGWDARAELGETRCQSHTGLSAQYFFPPALCW